MMDLEMWWILRCSGSLEDVVDPRKIWRLPRRCGGSRDVVAERLPSRYCGSADGVVPKAKYMVLKNLM